MYKKITSVFLLVLVVALANQSLATTEPTLRTNTIGESDSVTVKSRQLLSTTQEMPTVKTTHKSTKTTLAFWETEEEEDSTSNSALSFNFIYYIIEKFKFQVE